jgi:hypothetical protein
LEHLVGVFEEILEFVSGRSEYFLRQLRRHLDARHRRIFRDVADFIDLDARLASQRGFQLFRERRRFCVSAGEGAYKSRELRLRRRWRKVNARDSRGNQQLREAAFARGGPERHAVQQNLRSRSAQQHAAAAAVIQRVAQFFPRRFKLLRCFRVPKFVQPRKLQQNVQAADKRPRPASRFLTHNCGGKPLPLLTLFLQ